MSLTERVVKQEIKNLLRIEDTMDDRYDYLRLDKNERLLPFNPTKFQNFLLQLKDDDITGYYELGDTYRKLARFLNVEKDQIFLAHGSDLAIKSIFETCIGSGDHLVLHAPSYAMYRVYSKMFNATNTIVDIKDDLTVDIEKMMSSVQENTKMFVIENPNGFVGNKPTIAQLEYCASELNKKDIVFVIDEAYVYVENDKSETVELIKKYPNIIITQTFSKAHGLAGLRVGFLVGSKEMIQYISSVRPMHEIASISAIATLWMLENPDLLTEFHVSIQESKAYLRTELTKLDILYKETHTNFMLFYFPDEGRTKEMQNKLKEHKILIRRPFGESYLKGWSRVCIGSLSDSQRLITALQSILKK